MSLTAVRMLLPAAAAEVFSDALCEVGAVAVTVSDAEAGLPSEVARFGEPGANPALWDRCEVSALFPPATDFGTSLSVAASIAGLPLPAYSTTQVEETDWVSASRDQFQSIEVCPGLWVVPSWREDEALPTGATRILLDPGAAFGTGSHPTTQLCLAWLKERLARAPGASVLDYGTGSGILAIAAAKLGARDVRGVDIDAQALEVARYNATRNDVSVRFINATESLEVPNAGADLSGHDLVVANILANPLILLAGLLAGQTRLGGQIALAGVLADQAKDVVEAYRPWFELESHARHDEWVCLTGTRLQAGLITGP